MIVEIKLNDREVIIGADHADIVRQMARLQWPTARNEPVKVSEYMKGVAKRVKTQHSASIRWCCADHFVKDLVTSKLIEVKS